MEENKVYYRATTILTETEQSELAARLKAELEQSPVTILGRGLDKQAPNES